MPSQAVKQMWKWTLDCNARTGAAFPIHLRDVPAGAVPRSVQVQSGVPRIWMEVDPSAPKKDVTLSCIGTGFGRVPDGEAYLGTVVQGAYVWHVYGPHVVE